MFKEFDFSRWGRICRDPVTVTVATVAGTVLSAAGALYSGAQQKKQSDYQAAVYRQQAERERQIADLNARRIRNENERIAARQRALIAGSGGDLTSGSALLIQSEFAKDAAFEEALAVAGGDTNAIRLEQQAKLTKMEGRSAQTGSYFRAGTTLLKGGVQAFG